MATDDFDIFQDLQILALEKHTNPDESTFYRKLCRWFSSEFHTSIFEVEKQPLEYLLCHYFEHKLEKMSKEDLEKYKKTLIHQEVVLEEEEEDEAFFEAYEIRRLQKALDEKNAKLKASKPKPPEKEEKPQEPPPPDINLSF